jgi:hypothetical protein
VLSSGAVAMVAEVSAVGGVVLGTSSNAGIVELSIVVVAANSVIRFCFVFRASIKSGKGRGPSTMVLWYRRRASRYWPNGKTTPR